MKKAAVNQYECVACGCCENICPRFAITVSNGCYADIAKEKCVGCGLCKKICPASVIDIEVLSKLNTSFFYEGIDLTIAE